MAAGPAAASGHPGLRYLLLLVLCLVLTAHAPQVQAAAAAAAGASVPQHQHIKPPHYYQPQLLHYGSSVAPILSNYSFSSALDTFEICRQQAGMVDSQDVPQEELLQLFRLPKDLNKHKHLTLPQLVELLHSVQPGFRVVFEPMLSGETDIGRLLDPSPASHSLPKLVHFTVKDKNKLQPHQILAMASWAYYNPGYSLMLFDDADVRAFMTTYYPHLLPTFDGLGSPVERTDLWRYLVLCRMGGVYADSDVMAARPISQWAQDAGLLVGIENAFTTPEEARERSYSRQVQMVQWSIAARPGHPVVCRMGQYVAKHVAEEAAGDFLDPDRDHAILERTGPGIWSDSVHDYLKQVGNVSIEQLVGGGRVGDVRVLPQPVFGCPTAVFHAADPLPYVYHMFMGSWKMAQQPSGLTTFIRKLSNSLHRPQQLKQTGPSAAAAHAGAGTPAGAAGSNGSSPVHKHPRRPILEEQILQHAAQQKQAQQKASKQLQPAGAQGDKHVVKQPLLLHSQQQQQVATGGAGQADGLAKGQRQLLPAAADSSKPNTRKLRSAQVLLVRGTVPHTAEGLLMEPELPSRVLSGMPTMLLLVVLLLLAILYRRQWVGCSWRWVCAMDSFRAAAAALGLLSRSPLSRPHSRAHLRMSASSPVLVLAPGAVPCMMAAAPVAAAAVSSVMDRVSTQAQQDAVCYASSQHSARGHGHKRSWGSSTSFQQL